MAEIQSSLSVKPPCACKAVPKSFNFRALLSPEAKNPAKGATRLPKAP